jgi:DNA-binding winged helix-turn-helix (wHTH) protein
MFEKKQGQPLVSNSIIIGQTTFFPESRKLQIETEIIELSEKETRLLRIFAKQTNQLILREQFLKEVWEDEVL